MYGTSTVYSDEFATLTFYCRYATYAAVPLVS